jgi:hypothetical protein
MRASRRGRAGKLMVWAPIGLAKDWCLVTRYIGPSARLNVENRDGHFWIPTTTVATRAQLETLAN